MQVVPFPFEGRVLLHLQHQVQVGWVAIRPGLPRARHPDLGAAARPGRQFHLHAPLAHLQCPRGAGKGFLQADGHRLRFLHGWRPAARAPAHRLPFAHAAENGSEEIREGRIAEQVVQVDFLVSSPLLARPLAPVEVARRALLLPL